ncbi:hypothetical protein AB6A40_005364 [Gnathostoma spinigerum]|uniref:Calponin-homology (CH) domain-containing protein n=1 Tax=Gnathostoma spinigerum TaxID=75299 RepID=A0ABD6EGD0_9BILA
MSQSPVRDEDLLESIDPTWIKIQQNTFTRWVNQHLAQAKTSINDLQNDLGEDHTFIQLVQVLSHKSVGSYSRRVVFRSQKLENISLALKFLEEKEHIRLVNIDSAAIVDKNLKLILGLIWTLILHYSISSQIYDDVAVQEEKGTTQAPKQKLMQWIKAKLPAGLPFNNFTSDWNDGVLLGALVESCVPGSDLGWRDWVPDDALSSTRKAMFVAEEKLNIAPLITPEELINPMVDEKSVMTYLAQYPAAKYTPPVGSLRVDHAPYLKMPSSFMIETSSNLIRPTSISVLAPDEHEVSAVVKPISERAYTATYTPIVVGPHKIVVLLKDEGSGSVTKLVDDKVQVRQSPQLKYVPEGRVRKPMVFSMNTRDTTFPEAKIIDSEGRGEVIKFQSDGDQIRAAFTPTKSGVHRLIITHGGSHIPGSPFEINVKSSESYIVWGRGIVSDGVRVGDTVQFNLQGKTRPKQPFEVLVRDPEGSPVHCKEIESRYGDCSTFEYTPVKEGFYEVRVMYDGDHVENSPYKVRVSRKTDCPVRVFGSGLEGGIEKQASVFFLNACGVTDNLAFAIHGPSEAAISCVDNRDGTSLVSYIPKVAGIYRVNISLRNEEIRGSPFIVRVLSKEECLHLDEIRVVGFDRAEDEPLFPNQKARFMIDTTAANGVWPTVRLIDPQFEMSPLKMTRKSSGVFEGGFMPSDPGRYYFDVMAMNASLPNSPFQMNVRHPPTDAEALKMYGPGTEQTPVAGVQTEFYVDTAALGSGKLDVDLIDSAGNHHETEVIREGTTIYKVRYVLPKPGTYQLIVTFAGFVLRDVTFNVVPKVKKEDFVVKGTEKEKVLLGHVVDLNISAGHSVPSLSGLEVFVHEADGSKHKVEMRKDADDIYKGSWSMRSYGITKFLVYFDGVLVKESVMTVEKGLDVSKCVARGDGLKFATVNEPAKFQVTTQGAGDGRMALTIKGPSESHTSVKDLYDGSYLVEYVTTTPGLYEISVFFGEKKEPIPGSPFVVRADYAKDVDRITIDRPEKIRLNSLASLKVDASRTGVGELTAKLPSYCSQPIVKEVRPRIYEVTFTPSGTPGSILPLELMYDGQLIGKRPLSLIVDPETEPELVTVGGQNGILPKNLSASFPCTLFVDTSKAGKVTRISAEVNGPDGSPRNVTVTPTDNEHILKVQFDTDIEGVYKVWVFCNGLPTSAKPYEIKTVSSGHAEKCKIEGMSEEKFWQSGVPRQFVISKGNAGDGRLSIVPHSTLAFIAKQNEEPNGDILVQITPKEIGLYDLSLYYGGREIPGGRIRFESVLKREVSPLFLNKSPEIEYIPIEEVTEQSIRPYSFKFGFDRGWQLSDLKAVVATPSGQMNAATVQV